ncbi:MAG: TetR/AcrR family transcriptional regulator [Deltaproteobacteria bacterium]|nr:MAG: TetR/AcrR family transcriptional regulator [Deltaproteobacteria bacterium]
MTDSRSSSQHSPTSPSSSKRTASAESKRAQMRSRGRKSKEGPQRANGVATHQRILDVASTMFAAGGYAATSLRQIAGAADIDIATLKYHFGDKAALFAEVYRVGHESMLDLLEPCMERLKAASTSDELMVALDDFVVAIHDFLAQHFWFVRMVLFRLLEGSEEIISLEEALQGMAADKFDDIFQTLKRRKLIRDVDHRAVICLLISSFTSWFVIAEVKPQWIEDPSPLVAEGRLRSEAFFLDMLERLLLP